MPQRPPPPAPRALHSLPFFDIQCYLGDSWIRTRILQLCPCLSSLLSTCSPDSELMDTGGCEASGRQGDQQNSPEPHPALLLPATCRSRGNT